MAEPAPKPEHGGSQAPLRPDSPLPNYLRWSGPLLAAGFGLGSKCHRALTKARFAPLPTICVGNLSAGGTGKTPAVKYFARILCSLGRRPAVLMRGYKEQASDEAREITAAISDLKVPVLIGADRLASAQTALNSGCDAVLLDDGFQHWRMARDLDIVLIDALDPFGGGRLLPFGRLRESPAALSRASVVIVTRSDACSENDLASLRSRLKALAPDALQLRAIHKPLRLKTCGSDETQPLEKLQRLRVLAACGIGNPAGFQRTLSVLGCELAGFAVFPDHHNYTTDDLTRLSAQAKDLRANAIVVTEKDAVKIIRLPASAASQPPLLSLEVGFEILGDTQVLIETFKRVLALGDQRASRKS